MERNQQELQCGWISDVLVGPSGTSANPWSSSMDSYLMGSHCLAWRKGACFFKNFKAGKQILQVAAWEFVKEINTVLPGWSITAVAMPDYFQPLKAFQLCPRKGLGS